MTSMLKYLIKGFILIMAMPALAQDSTLLQQLEDSMQEQWHQDLSAGTFKATHIINTPTVEAPGKNGLEFLIMHRFGRLNEGSYALFGLDNATIRFGLDYGLTDRLSIGVGRSSLDKTYDGSVKWKALQQTKGRMPVTASLYGLMTHTTLKYPDKPYINSKYRTSYVSQLLLARKFNSRLSLQLSPTWIHFNLVPTPQDKNDLFALGIGGRMKITKRISINGEYNYLPTDQVKSTEVHHSVSFGFDIETGGHVFQLVFTNSEGMTAPYYLAKTPGSWGDGDIFFGFNISRAFSFKKR
jgi:opacity protein-like surface antigen